MEQTNFAKFDLLSDQLFCRASSVFVTFYVSCKSRFILYKLTNHLFCTFFDRFYDFWKFIAMTLSVGLTIGLAYLGVKNRNELRNFKSVHPCLFLGILFVISFSMIYLLKSTAVFLWAVLFPTFIFLVHASFRILNFGNSTDREQTRIGATYMGALLKVLDLISDNVFE